MRIPDPQQALRLTEELTRDLGELGDLAQRCKRFLAARDRVALEFEDKLVLGALVHFFYTGVVTMGKRINAVTDGKDHQETLAALARDPAVIGGELAGMIGDLRQFSLQFGGGDMSSVRDTARLVHLAAQLPRALALVQSDVGRFTARLHRHTDS